MGKYLLRARKDPSLWFWMSVKPEDSLRESRLGGQEAFRVWQKLENEKALGKHKPMEAGMPDWVL